MRGIGGGWWNPAITRSSSRFTLIIIVKIYLVNTLVSPLLRCNISGELMEENSGTSLTLNIFLILVAFLAITPSRHSLQSVSQSPNMLNSNKYSKMIRISTLKGGFSNMLGQELNPVYVSSQYIVHQYIVCRYAGTYIEER